MAGTTSHVGGSKRKKENPRQLPLPQLNILSNTLQAPLLTSTGLLPAPPQISVIDAFWDKIYQAQSAGRRILLLPSLSTEGLAAATMVHLALGIPQEEILFGTPRALRGNNPLIITLDQGAVFSRQIKGWTEANKSELIIIDHHTAHMATAQHGSILSLTPRLLEPLGKCAEIGSAGIVMALMKRHPVKDTLIAQQLEALSTIAILSEGLPLTKENLATVVRGLSVLNQSAKSLFPTLHAVHAAVGMKRYTERSLATLIAPLIAYLVQSNSPESALELLNSTSVNDDLVQLAPRLEIERKKQLRESLRRTDITALSGKRSDKVIIVVEKNMLCSHGKRVADELAARNPSTIVAVVCKRESNDPGLRLVLRSFSGSHNCEAFVRLITKKISGIVGGGGRYSGGAVIPDNEEVLDRLVIILKKFGEHSRTERNRGTQQELIVLRTDDELRNVTTSVSGPFGVGAPSPQLLFQDCVVVKYDKEPGKRRASLVAHFDNCQDTFAIRISPLLIGTTGLKPGQRVHFTAELRNEGKFIEPQCQIIAFHESKILDHLRAKGLTFADKLKVVLKRAVLPHPEISIPWNPRWGDPSLEVHRPGRRTCIEGMINAKGSPTVIFGPTGSGKTYAVAGGLAGLLSLDPHERALFVVPSNEVARQQLKALQESMPSALKDCVVYLAAHATKDRTAQLRDPEKRIVIITASLLERVVAGKATLRSDLNFTTVVLDEGHNAGRHDHSYSGVLRQTKAENLRLVYLSATPATSLNRLLTLLEVVGPAHWFVLEGRKVPTTPIIVSTPREIAYLNPEDFLDPGTPVLSGEWSTLCAKAADTIREVVLLLEPSRERYPDEVKANLRALKESHRGELLPVNLVASMVRLRHDKSHLAQVELSPAAKARLNVVVQLCANYDLLLQQGALVAYANLTAFRTTYLKQSYSLFNHSHVKKYQRELKEYLVWQASMVPKAHYPRRDTMFNWGTTSPAKTSPGGSAPKAKKSSLRQLQLKALRDLSEILAIAIEQHPKDFKALEIAHKFFAQSAQTSSNSMVIVFGGHITHVEVLASMFRREFGASAVGVLHGEMSPNARKSVYTAAEEGKLKILVGSSAISEGLHFKNAKLVICTVVPEHHTELPQQTGRAAVGGEALVLCTPESSDGYKLPAHQHRKYFLNALLEALRELSVA